MNVSTTKQTKMNQIFTSMVTRSVLAVASLLALISDARAADKPNVIVILADDLGYGDLSCYGAEDIATPNIDRMAAEGAKFNSFYVSPVCSPTRAALMTGSHSTRVGIGGVMFPRNNHGLNPDEITLPELLKAQDYATAIIGKWHLGNQDMFQPLNHGFDYWYGTPSSNSQGFYPNLKQYAADCVFREAYSRENVLELSEAKCPLLRNNIVIEVPADQTQFTQRYTRETIRFITENKDKPFFVYLAHNMPHIPLHASKEFSGSSERGTYGDTIQELDWSTGEILRSLKELGLDKKTLVIFTSDNGPNTSTGGSAGALKGAKGSTLEGGLRVPFIARWPDHIPAGTESDAAITIMDLLPTLTQLAGGEVPKDRVIDGKDIWPLLAGKPDAKSPHEAIYYLRGRGVDGIRVGDWKYLVDDSSEKEAQKVEVELTAEEKKLPRKQRNALIKQRSKTASEKSRSMAALYNLSVDVGEQNNLFEKHPEIVARLRKLLEAFGRELRANTRPAGVANPALNTRADVAEERLNVLFLIADDLNSWMLEDADRYAGKVIGPNLRKLAGSGVNFTRAYTASPVCSPSRTAFFSGVAPWRSGIYNNAQAISESEALNQDAVLSLAGLFKRSGYDTFGYGKITHGWDQKEHWNEHIGHKRDPAPPGTPLAKLSGGEQDWGPIHLTEEQMNDTRGADRAIAILERQHDKPFFLAYGSFNPHMPWYVPKKYFDMYPLDEIVLPELKEDDLDDLPPLAKAVSNGIGSFADKVIEAGKHKEAVQAYLATTTYVDTQFGRVLDALEYSPYKDNTIVVFLTDHGLHLGEKHHWQKTTLWEEGTHTLLMFRAPGVAKAGGVSERCVSLMDIYPTLAELCGLTPAAYVDGRSLVPLLKDPQAPWATTAITGLCTKGKQDGDAYISIRHELGRYTRYGAEEEEFYDTTHDPREWTNQIDNPKYADTIEQLRTLVPSYEAAAEPLPSVLTKERRETESVRRKKESNPSKS